MKPIRPICPFCKSILNFSSLCLNHSNRPMFAYHNDIIYKITFLLDKHTVYVYTYGYISIYNWGNFIASFNYPFHQVSPESIDSLVTKLLKLKAFL